MHGELILVRRRGGQTAYFLLGLLAAGAASANPQGAQVAAGTATFATPNPQTLEITNSPSAILNWQSFDIGAGETTRFIQQSAASAVLNRVTTQNSSEIFGNLVSNGQVFLINPAGILIGRDAKVDTAGLVMSTLQMSDADFLAGRLHFSGDAASGSLVNRGWIKAGPGGEIVLIAPRIENLPEAGNANSGLIQTDGGELLLAAGHAITIDSLDHPDITFEVQAPANEVVNLGRLLAEGGSVSVLAGTIRHSGEISADALELDAAGRIVMKAQDKIMLDESSVTSASSAQGAGGSIAISAGGAVEGGRIYQSGTVNANGATGGEVRVDGVRVLADGTIAARGAIDGGDIAVHATEQVMATSRSHIDASGNAGAGGKVLVDGGASVYTSGLAKANGLVGGQVHVFGDDTKLAAATIDASGVGAGGEVRVGGGYQGGEGLPTADNTEVNSASVIKADAQTSGNGGSVVVWADGATRYAGTISARGGASGGNGGTVEVSGKTTLGYNGTVDVTAVAGQAGTLLLDPKNVRFTTQAIAGAPVSLLDPNPGAGNAFGNHIDFVPGGFLVFDYLDDFGGTDAGAVYLFRDSDGALLSTLTGGQAGDRVGDSLFIDSVGNVDFLRSVNWNNDRGAITPFDVVNGTSGVVSSANSLVGANAGDQIGSVISSIGVNQIAIRSPQFNAGRGAFTIVAESGLVGEVTSANSLVGANAGDLVGMNNLVNLFNGNYALHSTHGGAGAVTFINPAAAPTGTVGAGNSLVGTTANDAVGGSGLQSLGGTTWAVLSPLWDNGVATNAGAITLFDAANGQFSGTANAFRGAVSSTNSLLGANAGDQLGTQSFQSVGSGTYTVRSTHGGAGAVTFIRTSAPPVGVIGTGNSLVGSTPTDAVGNGGVHCFSGSTCAVLSPLWDNGAATNAGAVTFFDGVSGLFAGTATNFGGAVAFANSLIGSSANDQVGVNGVDFAYGSKYAVFTPTWDNGAIANAGAITWYTPGTALSGIIDSSNSLFGANVNDGVGSGSFDNFMGSSLTGIYSLSGGNALLKTPGFGGGAAGAITFLNTSAAEPKGPLGAGNSIVGKAGDAVGVDGIMPISGSLYAIMSSNWDAVAPVATDAGAVTVFDAATGLFSNGAPMLGNLDASNSLVGSSASDNIGEDGVDYVFGSTWAIFNPGWDNGAAADAGAITWYTPGQVLVGAVSGVNSLLGNFAGDLVGGVNNQLYDLNFSGKTLLHVPSFGANAGAVVHLDNNAPLVGSISSINSLLGNPGEQLGSGGIVVENGHYLILSPLVDDGSNVDVGAVTIATHATAVTGFVGTPNSLIGGFSDARIGESGWFSLLNGNGLILGSTAPGQPGSVTYVDLNNGHLFGDTDFIATVDSSNSLIGNVGDQVGFGDKFGNDGVTLHFAAFDTYYIVNSSSWDAGGTFSNAGAVTVVDASVGAAGLVSASNSIVGGAAGAGIGGDGIIDLDNGNALIYSRSFGNNAGALTFLDLVNGNLFGDTDFFAVVDQTNSLLGASAGDDLGSGGIGQYDANFTGHFYAVLTPGYDNTGAGFTDNGAVTIVNANVGAAGFIGAANSIVGAGNDNDNVGAVNSLFELESGNLLLFSSNWALDQGAVTFINLLSYTQPGFAIDATNSLVGNQPGDLLGSNSVEEFEGTDAFAVLSPNWQNGALTAAGAISWGNQFVGFTPGVVDDSTALVGQFAGDAVGDSAADFEELTSTYWVLRTDTWNGGRSALTFFDVTGSGPIGFIDAVSLVGSTPGDNLGSNGIETENTTAGTKVIIASPLWDNGGATDAGAITVALLGGPITDVVGAGNSLVGTNLSDEIGGGYREFFDNGNQVFVHSNWNGGRGAVTFWNPNNSLTGTVGAGNSLVGTTAGDAIGSWDVFEIDGDRYVVAAPDWNNDMGAVTIASTATGISGAVSNLNSLVGSTSGDRVGEDIHQLYFNDLLLISSDSWNGNRGAVTLVNPLAPVVGAVSASNSIVGSFAGDRVGSNFFQLFEPGNQGLVVLLTPNWNSNAGAVTVFDSNAPFVGAVSEANSLVGRPGDLVGNNGVSELDNGGLFVQSAAWSDGTGQNFGAVTVMLQNGGRVTPTVGFVSSANSLVGSHANDSIGSNVTTLFSTDNRVVRSTSWNDNRGAVTFVNVDTGLTGEVSALNSLTGELIGDRLGFGGISQLGGDRFMVFSPDASVNGLAGAGRIDIIDGAEAQDVSGDIDFSSNPGGDLLISIASLVNFLNAGGTLNVQATNDIVFDIGQSISATGGSLILRAGRSIDIRADIILTGGKSLLSMTANDGGTDANFRDSGDGNVTLKADLTPLRVIATNLKVEAQNILLDAGNAPGAYVALIGLESADLHAHGSGLIQLTAGNTQGSSLVTTSSQDLFTAVLEDPASLTAPAAFILGRDALKLQADDIVLQGGGSAGAFAAAVSFGEFTIDALRIDLLPGSGTNADALLLALGGNIDIGQADCEACREPFFIDPLTDDAAQGGLYISGLIRQPSTDAILAMLGDSEEAGGGEGEDDDDDDDDDEDDERLECN